MDQQPISKTTILSYDRLLEAYQLARRGKFKFKLDSIEFNDNLKTNLDQLYYELDKGMYYPNPLKKFYISEPKERLILAPCFRDKVVHNLINLKLGPFFQRQFIKDSYSCIVGKGNRRALHTLHHYLNCALNRYGENSYGVKVDIEKFFYRIDRIQLLRELGRYTHCSWTLALLERIIQHDTNQTVGLPLGNLTSQLFANIYLNGLDHYIKRTLRVNYYIRYCDDLFLMTPDKRQAKVTLDLITQRLRDLALTTTPEKSYIFKLNQRFQALGYTLDRHTIRFKQANYIKFNQIVSNFIDLREELDPRMIHQSLNGWTNYLNTAHSRPFLNHLEALYPEVSIVNQHITIKTD